MIKMIEKNNIDTVQNLIYKNIMKNPYLYIDTQTYGYSSENVNTYTLGDDSDIYTIILKYYNTFQIMDIKELSSILCEELFNFVINQHPSMISGSAKIMKKLMADCSKEKNAKIEYGSILEFCDSEIDYSDKSIIANENQFQEIAELICMDNSIGGHYESVNLKKQLEERSKNYGCISRIIISDNKIAAHMATYANNYPIAVLGGLITHPDYRNKGYGNAVLNDLTKDVINDGNRPLLYVYKEKLLQWYLSMGWKKVCDCAKITFDID